MSMRSYVFYDTETSGTNVRFDQVFQFSAARCDDALSVLDAINLRCRRMSHIIPHPKALVVTGVDPRGLDAAPLSYHEFAREVHATFTDWAPAIFIAFNGMRFDEEILRSMFWQNLLYPYLTTSRGSKRLDLLAIIQTALALNPAVLVVPTHPLTGKPTLKLEHLAPANGFANHAAHDAAGDVDATIFLATLIRQRMPLLWDAMVDNATQSRAAHTADARESVLVTHFGKPVVHFTTVIAFGNANDKQTCLFDLAHDPAPLLDLAVDALTEFMQEGHPAFRRVKTNATPALFRADHPLVAGLAPTVPSTPEERAQRIALIEARPDFRRRVAAALDRLQESYAKSVHVEEQIYDGFTTRADEDACKAFHLVSTWQSRVEAAKRLKDARLRKLANLVIFQHAPGLMAPHVARAIAEGIAAKRLLTTDEVPWTTIPKALADLDAMEAEAVYDSAVLANIRSWLLEMREQAETALCAQAETARHPIQPVNVEGTRIAIVA